MTPKQESRDDAEARYVVFAGTSRVAAGGLPSVAVAARRAQDRDPLTAVLIFDCKTAEVTDLDLRGTEDEIVARLATPPSAPARRGRPRLGVVAREVTL